MGRGNMTKMIGFRPTEETAQAIAQLMKKEKLKTKTEAINKLVKEGLEHRASTEAPPKPTPIFQLESEETILPESLNKELQKFLRGKKSIAMQFFFSNVSTAHARGTY